MEETPQESLYDEFLHNIGNIKNLFDLMALCISYTLNKIDETEFDPINILNSFDSKSLEIIDSLSRYKQGKEIDIEYKCLEQLKIQLHNVLSENINIINICIQIIMWIDNNYEPEYENDGICTYEALNSQFNNKICIIPRINNRIDDFSSIFSDEKGQEAFRKDYPVRKVFYNNIICRYIILDEIFLKNYNVRIHHLGCGNGFVRKTIDKQTLSFAIFPVLNSDISEYFQLNKFKTEKISYFEIDGMHEGKEEALKQRYGKLLNSCNFNNIDFLIFPEMLMTKNILNSFKKCRTGNCLTFWGSIWEDMKNQSVITGTNGTEILSYDKKIGFALKGDRIYLEHLKERIKRVPYDVLDIEGIGRVGICICRDLTFQEVYNLHAYLETNILIVPAFSESMDIYTGAEELAKKEKCIVVLANSCSACYNKNTATEIGFLVVPAKKRNTRSVYKEIYGNLSCIDECRSVCKGILFTVDFSNKMEKDDLLTMKITKTAVIS